MSGNAKNHDLPDAIKTARLLLRAPDIADADAMQRLANNKTIHKFLARLPHPYKRADALDFITNMARNDNEHAYAIIAQTGEFIGIISLRFKTDAPPELGYWLGEPFWGQGYASEAANALVKAAFARGIDKIFARAIANNKGSINVLEKCGFKKTGEHLDDCGPHEGAMVAFFERERQRQATG